MSSQFWVYILLCSNESFYTGYTVDVNKRYQAHCSGTARCKYTQRFKPIQLLQYWEVIGTKSVAMKVERYIKQLSRKEKEQLLAEPNTLCAIFPTRTVLE
jgi:putative endonuclease